MQSTIQSIGAAAEQRIDTLARIVGTIRQPETPEVDALLRAALENLRLSSATVSVVGQVKAGKSSLVNAITGVKDLLPTEVNPWTAVITNLHFGHLDKPQSGGVFDLFSEDEWQQMVKGDAETRKMAEELLPGFDSKVLEQQIQEMQESARRRLGDLYLQLLGRQHQFNEVTPEILERYVSAGTSETGSDGSQSSAGKFSGITKSAAVFLPAGPFRVPMTVSDTPGINDPFLVRDEITTASFRFADIFIVAVSAHQALNAADVALLKMLSQHSAKKTIIYVNRIDELDDPASTLPEILKTLQKRLNKEIPNPNYIIRAGSAFWGQVAASGSDAEVTATVKSDAFKSFLEADDSRIDAKTQSPRTQLYMASGLHDLANTLSSMVSDGPALAALGDAVTKVQAVINLMQSNLKLSLESETEGHELGDNIEAVVRAETARILQRATRSTEIARQLQELSTDGTRHVYHSTDVALDSAEEGIRLSLEKFVEEQIAELRQRADGGKIQGAWALDTKTLGDNVVEKVRTNFRKCRAELDHLLVGYATKLNDVTAGTMADVGFDGLLKNLPFDEILPAFKPKTSMIQVDLSAERGWKFWKSKSMRVDEAINKILIVLKAELEPPLLKVIESLREGVDGRSEAALGRMDNVLGAAMELVQGEAQKLQQQAASLSGDQGKRHIAEIYEQRRERARVIEAKIDALAAAEAQILREFPMLARQTEDSDTDQVKVKASA